MNKFLVFVGAALLLVVAIISSPAEAVAVAAPQFGHHGPPHHGPPHHGPPHHGPPHHGPPHHGPPHHGPPHHGPPHHHG
ncbi:histidine-rich glycoprotein-like [Schistocerca gregaria]|uniref:histidine-rich glycoprotein-like n=1 Tax=Schistocerca gregaria TaxID=7010 RepID=UPI00211E7575|nr:histidine-rich glycoprotein-like [Schistocerca gregaria]